MSFVQPSPIFPGSHAEAHVEKHEAQKADQKKLAATEAKIQEATFVAENRAKQQISENRVLTAKFVHQLKEDLKNAHQLTDKQANEVIRTVLVQKPEKPGANDPSVQAVVHEEAPQQAKQQSEGAQQKSQADSSKSSSNSTDPSQSASAEYAQMVRGTKPVAQPQQTPQAQTQTNQQPQTQAQQQTPQSQPQQTPQPQVANAPKPSTQPGLPEQPGPQPLAQQQPGQTKQTAGPQQPGLTQTAEGQPSVPGQPVATGNHARESQPAVKLFSLGDQRFGTHSEQEHTLPAETKALLNQLFTKTPPISIPMPSPQTKSAGFALADRSVSSSSSRDEEGGSSEVASTRGGSHGGRPTGRDIKLGRFRCGILG